VERRQVTRLAAVGLLLLAGCGKPDSSAAGRTVARVHYSNPVFTRDFPDPMVLRIGPHDYWAYGTATTYARGFFPVLHSRDLAHWGYVGPAFSGPVPWVSQDYWAPDVVKRGRTYFLYFTGAGAIHCIGVATAKQPAGPFRPRAVVGCGGRVGSGYIDPDLFIDRDGKAYLYVSVDEPHAIAVIPMKPDLLHAAGSARALFGVSQPWEHITHSTVEGPFMVRHGNRYYLLYSGNDYMQRYAMGYATSRSPLGPFTKYASNPILKQTKGLVGPGGGSVFQGPDGRFWLVYHAWKGPEANGGRRVMYIDPLVWHSNRLSVRVHL
jgi:xylan 1,4-beta-xylosidase